MQMGDWSKKLFFHMFIAKAIQLISKIQNNFDEIAFLNIWLYLYEIKVHFLPAIAALLKS